MAGLKKGYQTYKVGSTGGSPVTRFFGAAGKNRVTGKNRVIGEYYIVVNGTAKSNRVRENSL